MAPASAYALLFFAIPFIAAATSMAPPAARPNPVEILTKDGRFGTLLKLLRNAQLVPAFTDRLSLRGISIFAPTDSAFKKIASVTANFSSDNRRTMLLYHGLASYVTFNDLDGSYGPFETLARGLILNVTGRDSNKNITTGVTNTKVGAALYDASPLAIFPVEDVLIPPTFAALPSPLDILKGDGRFSFLLRFLAYWQFTMTFAVRLNSVGVSIFAPTDDAFHRISAALGEFSNNFPTMLFYHWLDKYVTFDDLHSRDNPFGTLAPGLTLNFTGGRDKRNVTTGVTNTRVGTALYDAFPLAIFPLENVLLPPAFAATLKPVRMLRSDGRFKTFLKLLKQAKLLTFIDDRLSSGGITIFAPTEVAFEKISSGMAELTRENITTILLYHGLDKYVTFDDLDERGNPFETLAGGLTLNFSGGGRSGSVFAGVTHTPVGSVLYDVSPLGMFLTDDVLIPPTFAVALPPKAAGPTVATPGPFNWTASARMERVRWEVLVGGVLACMSLF